MGEFTTASLLGLLMIVALTPYAVWTRSPARAVLFVAFGAALFGPEASWLKFPLSPPLDKTTLPYVCLMVAALWKWRAKIKRSGRFGGVDWLIALAMFTEVGTALTNTDTLVYGSWMTSEFPGMTLKDGLSNLVWKAWHMGFPFLLGRWCFRDRRDLDALFKFLVIAGLIQSVIVWIELRMSPVTHMWAYGYGAHGDFLQVLRWGGYRPSGFMSHGLALALFMCIAVLSAALLKKGDESVSKRFKPKWVFYYLLLVLVLCKSTGAILYALAFAPLILRAKPKTQVRVALVLALITAFYPALRSSDMFPTRSLVDVARSVSDERAQSLEFRFVNEDLLLDKARERILFGWGTYGRHAVYDDEMGKEKSTTDGYWIILVSSSGIIGFIAAFGLLLAPIFSLRTRFKYCPDDDARRKIAALALLLTVITVDLLPNGNFGGFAFLVAGALYGLQQELMKPRSSWRR